MIMNNYFTNIVPLLNIQGYKCDYINDNSLDEITNVIHKYKLHPRCLIAAAGNLTTDREIVNTQSTATTSR